jgi:hypothetical protein
MQQPSKSPVSPSSLLAVARELSAAVSTLALHAQQGSARARALLAAHSVELSLKSFLLSRGWSEDQVHRLGHNLLKAWSAARAAGLPLDPEPPYWCQLLQTVHDSPYFGRYPPANSGLVTPNAAELSLRIEELISLVEAE